MHAKYKSLSTISLGKKKDGYTHIRGQKCESCGKVKLLSEYARVYKGSRFCTWLKSCEPCKKLEASDRNRRKKLDLSKEEYENILRGVKKCQICGGDQVKNKRLAIDHSHVTGKIRGVLCTLCNTGLGSFREDIDVMISAINYLTLND